MSMGNEEEDDLGTKKKAIQVKTKQNRHETGTNSLKASMSL